MGHTHHHHHQQAGNNNNNAASHVLVTLSRTEPLRTGDQCLTNHHVGRSRRSLSVSATSAGAGELSEPPMRAEIKSGRDRSPLCADCCCCCCCCSCLVADSMTHPPLPRDNDVTTRNQIRTLRRPIR